MVSTFVKCQIFLALVCHVFCDEPTEEDLKCFNDYEKEMKCTLKVDRLKSCSGYKLDITHKAHDGTEKMYACIFERSHHSDYCECKVIIVQGFVITETFITALLEGTNVLLRKTLQTEDFIKPKTPVLSVQNTENGNFIVTWNNQYVSVIHTFLESLTINLTYGMKGGLEYISNASNTLKSFDIVGNNLQPNTNYILTATMSTYYNYHSIPSDRSAPVEFTTSSSPNEWAKTVIPSLCVGLIIIIIVIFICILRMKTNWWDKISKPKIDVNLREEKGHILPPSDMMFSPIHVEIPTLDLQKDKKLISALSVDTNNEKSFHSVQSAPVDYGQAGPDSCEENISTIDIVSRVERALDEVLKLQPVTNKPSQLSPYNQINSVNGISSSKERNRINRDSGNCSGSSVFSNMSYLESATGDSLFLEQLSCDHGYQSGEKEVSDSDARDSQFNSPTNDTLEDGYQCFSSVLEKGNDADVRSNLSGDVGADEKCIMKNLITSTNPLYPSLILHDGDVTPSDEGYQAFQGLTKSTEGPWSTGVTTEQALKACGALKFPQSTGQDPSSEQQSSWDTSLHFSPIIQIDSSYQCV